ncbi:transglutaminase TgpA family protein [Alteribacillus iranensis]|nr:transglutaminaseTgpA domain-containing protein [Alteribacillus iranensis]
MYNYPRLFLSYVLGYLLFMEWLLPLPEITDTGYLPLFMGIAGVFFLITFLSLPWWASVLLFTGGLLFGLHLIFYENTFLSMSWWSVLFQDVFQNVHFLLRGEWFHLSDSFRSFLFLLLLAIMSYLLYFWVVQARRILFFFVFTVIYIAVMDTFTVYDGQFAIMRVFIIGFLLLALLQWDRLSAFFIGERSISVWLKWITVSLGILVIAAGVGMTAPKMDPQWPDPVPYLKTAAGLGEGKDLHGDSPRVIGYGENDEQLGGGFAMDDTRVFTAVGEGGDYWRGESKNVYTGHGWKSNTPQEPHHKSDFYDESVPREEKEIEVSVQGNWDFQFAFYPGELLHLQAPEEEVETEIDRYSGKARTFIDGNSYQLRTYQITYEDPEFPVEKMKEIPKKDPRHITDHYLSLPDELPASIQNLAEEITEGMDNRYDKVRAIESYFHGPDFTYETQNIPIPEEGEDYVEQFLFETQRGYCDNFSTSMAVMLRTLDIPTRWVKGFTSGEEIKSQENETVYEVTNANAHSWVEVYFPEVGWVPFEPTKGFAGSFDYNNTNTETEEPEEQESVQEEEKEEEEEESKDSSAANSNQFPWWPFLLGVSLIALVVYIFRMRILKKLIVWRFKHVDDSEGYTKAFHSLLWLLGLAGYKKEASETLREYAARMDDTFKTEDMSILTKEYEKIHYGNQEGNPDKLLAVWECMIQRIKA